MSGILSSANNAVLVDNCQSLQNLTVTLQVTEDLITVNNGGFSLQLNCYPQPGLKSQGQTLTEQEVGDLSLTWFQYVVIIQNGLSSFEIQYWANGAFCYLTDAAGNCVQPWPSGYTPNPPGTTPWLPVFPNTGLFGAIGSAPSSQLLAGSIIEIQLTTDASTGNVVSANFSVTDPSGKVAEPSTQPTFPAGAQFPIYGFQVDVVGPPSSTCTFTSGTGILTYSVSQGVLSVQTVNTCGGSQPSTAETSNAFYGDVTPPSGSTVHQTLNVPTTDPPPVSDKLPLK
jgi:hypothetical protein